MTEEHAKKLRTNSIYHFYLLVTY